MSIFSDKLRSIIKRTEAKAETPNVEPKQERMFNIHKRSVPPKIDKVVVYNIPSRQIAERMLEKTVDFWGRLFFRTRLYHDNSTDLKTYIFYDVVPTDATPKERSIYYNPPLDFKDIEF